MSVETLNEFLAIKVNGPIFEDYGFRNAIERIGKLASKEALFSILLYRKALIRFLIHI